MVKTKAYGVLLYKIEKRRIKILLCKSVTSRKKWGCFKGCQENERPYETAIREFYEESKIHVNRINFEEYFEQKNEAKDIGIWLVNAKNVHDLNKFFTYDELKSDNLSWEIIRASFFDIYDLPPLKNNQKQLLKKVIGFLRNKNRFP